ncbi:fibronectin type III domain-containing protein [Blastococcus sp. SYSU DS0541]
MAGGLSAALATSAIITFAAVAEAGTPPAGPGNIEIFNKRSMVALEGYTAQAGQEATVEVIRGSEIVGIGRGTIDDTGFLEFNHPGGECWIGVTPNIKPGDEVKVSFSGALFTDSAVTMSPTVTSVVGSNFVASGEVVEGDPETRVRGTGTVTINGTYDPADPWFDPARFVIETVNPDNKDDKTPPGEDPGLVDARAMGITLVPDAEHPNGEPGLWDATATIDPATGTWSGTYTLYTEADYDRTLAGDHVAASWMAESGELALGLTQNEFEEIPGPGMGGCPPSPDGQVPTAPTTAQLSSATGSTSVDVTWEPAAQPADAPEVTGYRVAAIGGAHLEQEVAERTGATAVSLDGLEAGASYEIMIEAYNGRWSAAQSVGSIVVGSGGGTTTPTDPTTPTEPSTAPAAPTGLAAEGTGLDSVTVTWAASPAEDAVTSYTVTATAASGEPVTLPVTAPATSATLTGLGSGTVYDITLTATNSIGTGAAAGPVQATTLSTAAPSSTTVSRVISGHERVTMEWLAATPGNSASPVTGYELSATPVDSTGTATGESVTASVGAVTTGTISGLTNGTTYRLDVVAVAGESRGPAATFADGHPGTVVPNDVLTVGRAQFRDDRNEYRITGTAQDTTANTVTIRLSTGELVAQNVAVTDDGAWSVSTRNGPQATPGATLTVTSSSGGSLTGVPMERR